MEGYRLAYSWQFPAQSSAESLWPYLSNLNLFFKSIGLSSIKKTTFSRSTPKDFHQLMNAGLLSYNVWEEQPYQWEYPFRYGTVRSYRIGLLENLKFTIDLTNYDDGTIIKVKLTGNARNTISKHLLAFYMTSILRRQLRKTIQYFDDSIQNEVEPYELSKTKSLPTGAKARIEKIKDELIKLTRRPRTIKKLLDFIQKAEDWELSRIHSYELAQTWGENKYAVLNVFLNAAKLELLEFGWDISCPKCNNVKQHIYRLSELRSPVFCEFCGDEFDVDFNGNVYLVFRPHPLIRKPNEKIYSVDDPRQKNQIVVQKYLNIGDVSYLNVMLEEGTYHIRKGDNEEVVTLHVDDLGLDTINVIFSNESSEKEEIQVSSEPNITFTNKTHVPILCTIENSGWSSKKIHATEILSQHDFKSLYNDEIIKEGENFKAKDLTILFTDLMDSTSIYQEHGDEMAIGQVMSHFKIIQQIVAEERGSIVKTIGDAVMAVFRNPMNAIKAVDRIQNILSTSTSLGDSFKLKAGIHIGDCTAVNLNNRIDYFGTTVNIASRLVDYASEREIVLSKEVYEHSEVKRFLAENNDKLFVKEANANLKGFDENEFPIKQIRLEKAKLRLVI